MAGRGKDIMAKEWFKDLDLDGLRQKNFVAPYIPEAKHFFDQDSDDESFGSDADFTSTRSVSLRTDIVKHSSLMGR